MIDNLSVSGPIKEKLYSNLPESTIYDLSFQIDEVNKIIEYFREINIKVIEELLLNRISIFFNDVITIKQTFESYNKDVVVKLINADYTTIDEII